MPTNACFQLLYTSRSYIPVDDGLLLSILETSRRNNLRAGITGVLICRERRFLQLLEGDEAAVKETYQRILRDDRHGSSRTLVEGPAKGRIFPSWSMGYIDPKTSASTLAELWPSVEAALRDEAEAAMRIIAALRRFNER